MPQTIPVPKTKSIITIVIEYYNYNDYYAHSLNPSIIIDALTPSGPAVAPGDAPRAADIATARATTAAPVDRRARQGGVPQPEALQERHILITIAS